MSVSLLEVLESVGYHPTTNVADARWLQGLQEEFDDLLDAADDVIETFNLRRNLEQAIEDGDEENIEFYKEQLGEE